MIVYGDLQKRMREINVLAFSEKDERIYNVYNLYGIKLIDMIFFLFP